MRLNRSRSRLGAGTMWCLGVAAFSALMLGGCTSRAASRYDGSVTNDSFQGSPGALTVTALSWTDTSFGGYLEIGPPLSGSGEAYGWFPNGQLTVVTVSRSGDTILWKSDSEGPAIGGRYSIIGGRYEGQGGSWSARLAKGRAITAQNPSGPGSLLEVGNVEAVLALGLVAIVAWLAARWVSRYPPRPVGVGVPSDTRELKLKGVGGWMAWFILGQALTVLIMIVRLPELWNSDVVSTWRMGSLFTGLRSLLALEGTVHVGQVVLPVIGLYLTTKSHPAAPRFWFAYLVALIVYGVVDIVGAEYFKFQILAIAGGAQSASETDSSATAAAVTNLRLALWASIWSLYWVHSKRVRLTFGHGALDKPLRSFARKPNAQIQAGRDLSNVSVAPKGEEGAKPQGVERQPTEVLIGTAPVVLETTSMPEGTGIVEKRVERPCPWCAEEILAEARYCRYCHRDVEPLV